MSAADQETYQPQQNAIVQELDYVARCKSCGRIVGWAHSKLMLGELSSVTSNWLKNGLSVERMMTPQAQAEQWGHIDDCEADPLTPKKRKTKETQTTTL